MDFKFLFFYLSLAIFIFRFTPLDFFPISYGYNLISIISGIYLIIFSLHMLIKYLKEIKTKISSIQLSLSTLLVNKKGNYKKDLIHFFIISLFIAFSIDIILIKISDKPLWDFLKYLPGIDPILDFIDLNQTATTLSNGLNSFFNPYQKSPYTSMNASTSLNTENKSSPVTTKHIKPFIDVAIGAFILFLLRQLLYRNRHIEKTDPPKNPGARLLVLFLIATMIILLLDFIQDLSSNTESFKKILFLNKTDITSELDHTILNEISLVRYNISLGCGNGNIDEYCYTNNEVLDRAIFEIGYKLLHENNSNINWYSNMILQSKWNNFQGILLLNQSLIKYLIVNSSLIDEMRKDPSLLDKISGETIDNLSGSINFSIYGIYDILTFFLKLTNPLIYITIISIWIFDRYLFSRIWISYKK